MLQRPTEYQSFLNETALDFIAGGVVLLALGHVLRRLWQAGFARRAHVYVQYEGALLTRCLGSWFSVTKWPVFWTVFLYFCCFLVAFVTLAAVVGEFNYLYVTLAGLGAWYLAWGLFISMDFMRLKLVPQEEHRASFLAIQATLDAQTLAIQETDLLSTCTTVLAVFVTSILWVTDVLDDTKNRHIETYSTTVLWPRSRANYSSAAAIQEILNQTCPNRTAPELFVSTRTWNSTAYQSFHVGTPSELWPLQDWWYEWLKVDQWYGLLWVLVVSMVLQCERACRNKVLPGVKPANVYDPEVPDVTRWVEYAFTSPVQVFLVAVNVGCTQDELLWMLMAAQAMLMYMGYAIELCLYHRHAHPVSASSKIFPDSVASAMRFRLGAANRDPSIIQYLPVETHNFRIGCGEAPLPGNPVTDITAGLWTMAHLIGVAFAWHLVLWRILVDAFNTSSQQFNECQKEEVPAWIQYLLYLQFGLFTLFGVVQLVMAAAILLFKKHCAAWRWGTMSYSVLSVTAKTTLDLLFIVGTTMRE